MDFPKKQQQCLIPRYLLQYLQDLQISHNDPTAPWGGGGGGGSYTAGDGIDITNDVISVDDTVALKTDLLDYVTTSELTTELSNYVTSTDLATELLDYAELSDLSTVATTGDYNDLTNKPTIPTNYVTTNTTQTISGSKTFTNKVTFSGYNNTPGIFTFTGLNPIKMIAPSISPSGSTTGLTLFNSNNDEKGYLQYKGPQDGLYLGRWGNASSPKYAQNIGFLSELGSNGYRVLMPNKTSTSSATTTANTYYIPTEITNGTTVVKASSDGVVDISSLISGGGTTVSGTNDGTNWTSITIGSDTYGIPSGGGSSYSAGTGIDITNNVISIDNSVATQAWTQSWVSNWVTNKGYSTFSGSYNDLTNKPTIPDAVSGTNDGTNWTSLTIGSDTYGIPSGGGGGSYSAGYGIDITNDTISIDDNVVALKIDIPNMNAYVNINTNQDITGAKTFVGNQLLRFKQSSSYNTLGFTAYDNNDYEIGNLQIANRTVGRTKYNYVTLGNWSSLSTKSKVGFRVQPNSSTNSYNFVMPYGSNSNFASNTYSTSSDTTIPCAFTDGTTIVKADATGLVNISSISGGGGGGTTVSGTNDGTNWTSITIGSDTYGIPSGGGSSSPVYAIVDIDGEKVNGEAQDLDNDYTSFYFSLIVDISNMTINDAKELYNNNNANYDFAASAATYSSNFNYGRISFSDDTGEHHINSITYDSVNEIVTIYYDNSTKTYTFTENELTNSSLQIDNIIQGSNEPAVYNFTLADWTADTSTNGYISNTAMVREGLDLSTLSAGQTVKIDCIFVRPSNGTSYVHQFTLVIPDGTMATESTDTFQIPGTNQTNLQIEAWMQISNNRIGLFWNNSKTRYISKVKVYPANA